MPLLVVKYKNIVSHGHSMYGIHSVGVLLLEEKVRKLYKLPTVAKIGGMELHVIL